MQGEAEQQHSTEGSGWQYNPDAATSQDSATPKSRLVDTVSWTASEYIDHQKSAGWYGLLALAALAAMVLTYFITRDVISTSVIGIVAILLAIVAARKPRTMQYSLTQSGIKVGSQMYPYTNFKSFSIIDEGALNSISLFPMKRFMPPLSIYYDPQDEDKIAHILGDYLPFVEDQHDRFDHFMRRIRF